VYITIDESDEQLLRRYTGAGFTVNRHEDEYLIPTEPRRRLRDIATAPTCSRISNGCRQLVLSTVMVSTRQTV
jgi:hypothetical protein